MLKTIEERSKRYTFLKRTNNISYPTTRIYHQHDSGFEICAHKERKYKEETKNMLTKYKATELEEAYFITSTTVGWEEIFTRLNQKYVMFTG